MKIDIIQKSSFQILKIEEELNVISELPELRFLIQGYLKQGKRHIAVHFTNASYIYSGAIAVLVECYKKIRNDDGILCLVEPQPQISSIFRYLNLDQLIPVYDSIDDLPAVSL